MEAVPELVHISSTLRGSRPSFQKTLIDSNIDTRDRNLDISDGAGEKAYTSGGKASSWVGF